MVAEFEADLIKSPTKEGMRVGKANVRLRRKQLKLTSKQEAYLVDLYRAGEHTSTEIAELFEVARSTMYEAVERYAKITMWCQLMVEATSSASSHDLTTAFLRERDGHNAVALNYFVLTAPRTPPK